MQFQDYYEVLDVPREADAKAIKRAYRKAALKWHPDKAPPEKREQHEERFKRLSEAYEVLSDPESRARYDRLGEHWKQGQEFRPPQDQASMTPEEFEARFGSGGFSDFFESLFGDRFARQVDPRGEPHGRFQHRGADVRADLSLGPVDAVKGGRRSVTLPASQTCERCAGVGFVGDHVCPRCLGVGRVRTQHTVDLTLPPGLSDGRTMRLRGLGEPGRGEGEPGDLMLSVRVVSDALFRVDGRDLSCDLPVAPWEALLGATVTLATPDGPVSLRVPPGTKAGARLRLAGRGLGRSGARGDLHAVVRLALPEPLDTRQRELLEELSRSGGATVRGGAREEES